MADATMDGPHNEVDEALDKTHEIFSNVQQILKMQEEADRRATKEVESHNQTKDQCKSIQDQHKKVNEMYEQEQMDHNSTKSKLDEALKAQQDQQESFKEQLNELATMKLSNEALKLEMEAQRKAFQVDVNWAARHVELLKKHQATKNELSIIDRERKELADKLAEFSTDAKGVKEKLAELQRYKELEAEEVFKKKRGRGQAMAALEKQLAQSDGGFVMLAFNGWNGVVKHERDQRIRKDKAMIKATRAISQNGQALLGTIFSAWTTETQAAFREKLRQQNDHIRNAGGNAGKGAERARQNALKALERGFAARQAELGKLTFDGWRNVRLARERGEQNKNGALRNIANSDTALQAQCLSGWKGLWATAAEKKAKKEGSMQRAMRMIAGASQALLVQCADAWLVIAKKTKAQLKKMAMVERNLLSEGRGLCDLIITKWGEHTRTLKAKSARKDAAMQRCLRSIASGTNALLASIITPWRKLAEEKAQKNRTSEQSMQRAARMISNSQGALLAGACQGWASLARKSAGRNTKLRVLQRLMDQDAKQVVIAVFYGWVRTSESPATKMQIEAQTKQLDELKAKSEEHEKWAEEQGKAMQEKEKLLTVYRHEVEDSRRKARAIKEELEKVSICMPPRSSRPSSGTKSRGQMRKYIKDDSTALPRIDGRESSGTKSAQPGSGAQTSRPSSRYGERPQPTTRQAWQES